MLTPKEQLLRILFKKELGATLSHEEELLYQQWKQDNPDEVDLEELDKEIKLFYQLRQQKLAIDHRFKAKLRQRLAQEKENAEVATAKPVWKIPGLPRIPRLLQKAPIRWAMVAAILVLVLWCVWHYGFRTERRATELVRTSPPRKAAMVADSLTMADSITVTLASGDVVAINTHKLLVARQGHWLLQYKDSMLVYKPITTELQQETVLFNTIQVPKRKQLRVVLPDGSIARLNAMTKLALPLNRGAPRREMTMEGDITFEVAEDYSRPFIVDADGIQVRAVGTIFTVEAYKGERYKKIILQKGGIVISNGKVSQLVMHPQVWKADKEKIEMVTNDVKKTHILISETAARGHGYFYFADAPLSEIVPEIERWYGLKLVTPDIFSLQEDRTFHIDSMPRTVPFTQLAKALEASERLKVSVKGNNLYIINAE